VGARARRIGDSSLSSPDRSCGFVFCVSSFLFALSAARGKDYFQALACRKMKNIACHVLIFMMAGKIVAMRWNTGFACAFEPRMPGEITSSASKLLFRTIPFIRVRAVVAQALLRPQKNRPCASKVSI
jgi:hypothetical protein